VHLSWASTVLVVAALQKTRHKYYVYMLYIISGTYTFLFILTASLLDASGHVHARCDFTDVLFILVGINAPTPRKGVVPYVHVLLTYRK
jgi:hypothetical protein